ncbi:MAG TPA: hypothetical protein VGX76_07385 [Pirellulales bacterium]|jgi:antitoxin (DNA-binding transcriptional repressor) of toxin-antitoxin stability system|nr:hypothetical protein [Pirellulales bacterium]
MSTTVTLEEAEVNLRELVGELGEGEEIVIVRGGQPIARLIGKRAPEPKPRAPGNCKGMITLLVEDTDHLKDFEEYMP